MGIVTRRSKPLRYAIGGLIVLSLVSLVFHPGPLWDQSLASVSPLPPQQQALDDTLRHEIGAPDVRYLVIANAPDEERALEISEALAAQLNDLVGVKALAGYDAPSDYLPSYATQDRRRSALPNDPDLRANFSAALVGLPFRADIFAPFFDDIAAAHTAPQLSRADLDGTSLALKVDSMLVQRVENDTWTIMLPLRGVIDAGRIEVAVKNSGATFINLKTESDRLLRLYRHEALLLSLSGAVAIAALLLIVLRSWRRTMVILTPLAAATLVVLGVLTLGHHTLSIFNLFGLLLTVAVGSNYCLFFEGLQHDRAEPERTLTSLVLANLCTIIGFGVLSFSPTPVLHGIGSTVALGAFLSLLFAAILIPHRQYK